jgi:hypothetical protein
MDKKPDIQQQRSLWLGVAKQIVEKCFSREARLLDLCPRYLDKDGEKANALKAISGLTKEIGKKVQKLKDIERDGGMIGFTNVLGNTPEDEVTTVVLVLLVAARLDCSAAGQLRTLADLMNQAAVRNPVVALQVRGMFRPGTALFPLVVIGRGICADECFVTLRESVFNRILAQPSDALEMRLEAEALVGKIR